MARLFLAQALNVWYFSLERVYVVPLGSAVFFVLVLAIFGGALLWLWFVFVPIREWG